MSAKTRVALGLGCLLILVMFSMFWPGLTVPAVADPVTLVSQGASGEAIGGSVTGAQSPLAPASSDGRYVCLECAPLAGRQI